MQTPLRIRFQGLDPSEALEEAARKGIEKLEQFFDRIIGCEIAVERVTHRHRKGDHFLVRITLSVPGESLTVGHDSQAREPNKDVYLAMRDAFRQARRQLGVHAQKREDRVKAHAAARSSRVRPKRAAAARA
jgi:ribosomal subunit interface protein